MQRPGSIDVHKMSIIFTPHSVHRWRKNFVKNNWYFSPKKKLHYQLGEDASWNPKERWSVSEKSTTVRLTFSFLLITEVQFLNTEQNLERKPEKAACSRPHMGVCVCGCVRCTLSRNKNTGSCTHCTGWHASCARYPPSDFYLRLYKRRNISQELWCNKQQQCCCLAMACNLRIGSSVSSSVSVFSPLLLLFSVVCMIHTTTENNTVYVVLKHLFCIVLFLANSLSLG